MPNTKRPILLLLDWDGTLTTTSTLPLIASIATLPTIHPSLHALSAAYNADLKSHDENYRPAKPDRTTLDQELTYLASLSAVEKASVERLEAAGIFKDVRADDVDGAAARCWGEGTITLRSGWRRLIESVRRRGRSRNVGIVSVAWSRRFIAKVLGEADRAAGGEGDVVDDGAVIANEIAGDGSGVLDRYFEGRGGGGGVWTAADKAGVMGGVAGGSFSGDEGRGFVVYIGDAVTDLACLVAADVGICIRDKVLTGEQEALREVLERVGVECASIREFSVVEDGMEEGGKELGKRKLWWATGFEEVCRSGLLD